MTALRNFRSRSSALLAAAAFALLGGCGIADNYPLKGDARPHPGVAAAKNYAVQGIDISRWQGEIDWAAVKGAGTRFVYMKATEGGDHVDPAFQRNWDAARRAGVRRGAYHFVYWCRPAHEQAVWFKQQIPNDPDALPPVLDVEWNGHSKTCPKKIDRALAIEKIQLMLTELEQLTGKKPVIYTDITFHKDVLEGEFNNYPYWIRSTAALPEARYENRPWAFWQFTTTGRVPGIRGDVDRNAFFGSEEQFIGWINGEYDIGTRAWTKRRQSPAQPSPSIVNQPPQAPEQPIDPDTPVALIPGAIEPVSSSFRLPPPRPAHRP